ncbi:MAG TPA: putative 2OG-Fe(II) oxygenase [Sphingomicrobium sp.]|nr:putative 2OG-Fe(II) oxygenase [Sphingomicrobium sp.]
MSFQSALAAVGARSFDLDLLDDLARAALAEGEEAAALGHILPAAKAAGSARLWQWVGLLHRSLDEHEPAIAEFERAAELAPNDAGIAHGRARVALEAGLDSVDLFLRARSLAPQDGSVLIGLAAARNAGDDGETAAGELAAALERSPAWLAGYEALAQLLATLGHKDRATDPLERAIARFPEQEQLWAALFNIRVRQEDFGALAEDIVRAEAVDLPASALAHYRAVVAAELDDQTLPKALFDSPRPATPDLAIWRVRHLLRVGAVDVALPYVDAALAAGDPDMWPYAATAWRLAGDPRSAWLEGEPALVQTIDLTDALPPLPELAAFLRGLHSARGEYLDQSVRGGTQTDGPLLSRIDPPVRRLRKAIEIAVKSYVAKLPPNDNGHPLLRERRDRKIRFSGSWSVRLRSGGRHANHVHPQGWISSALYIALPPRDSRDAKDAGWLTLGGPPENLHLSVQPWRKIEPVEGRLALFPSWMWHGTRSFDTGERLTVAFDVRPPI